MADWKQALISIETQHLTSAVTDYQPDEQFFIYYQSAIRLLMYAMLGTRPDHMFAVSVVS